MKVQVARSSVECTLKIYSTYSPGINANFSADYRALASHVVAVVTLVYLNAYLVSDQPPKVDEYLPGDYKPFWAKRK